MISVSSILTSPMIALKVMQTDRSSETASGQEPSLTAANPLSPTSAYTLSPRSAAAITALRLDVQRTVPTADEFARLMKDTPKEVADRLKSYGATKWIRTNTDKIDGETFRRSVASHILSQSDADYDGEQGNYLKQAFRDGTVVVKQVYEVPELKLDFYSYKLYNENGDYGGAAFGSGNDDYLITYRKDNPDMNVDVAGINNHLYIMYWPKTTTRNKDG